MLIDINFFYYYSEGSLNTQFSKKKKKKKTHAISGSYFLVQAVKGLKGPGRIVMNHQKRKKCGWKKVIVIGDPLNIW